MAKYSSYPVAAAILVADSVLFLKNSTTAENLVTFQNLIASIISATQTETGFSASPANTIVVRDPVGDVATGNVAIHVNTGSGAPSVRYGHIQFAEYPGSPSINGDHAVLLATATGDPDNSGSMVVRDQGGLTGIASVAGFTAGPAGFRTTLSYWDINKVHALPDITGVNAPIKMTGTLIDIQPATAPSTPGYMLGSDRALIDTTSYDQTADSLVRRAPDGSGKFTDLRCYDGTSGGAAVGIYLNGASGISQTKGAQCRTGTTGVFQASDAFNISWDGVHMHLWHNGTDLGYFNLT